MMNITGSWNCKCTVTGVEREASVPVQTSLEEFRLALKTAFAPDLDCEDYIITDFNSDIEKDQDLAKVKPGEVLWVVDAKKGLPPAKERVAFPPHPKTLTRAGDYEYFAAQGRAPFPYALAELIDNSLRATFRGRSSCRQITISFVLNNVSNPTCGLVSVWDNGCGMTKRELNEWAVMNLSMEDRGATPLEEEVQRGDNRAPGASRFLTGNLSYFGVGSKNAAFYLGKRIKVATRHAGSKYVHELSIAASDLEQRYRDGKAVYEEDLIHREPGDASTVSVFESSFPIGRAWVAEELTRQGTGNAVADAPSDSFTRIVIGDLKPEILQQVANTSGRQQLCRSLAHLYHYYLHGEQGNLHGASQTTIEDAPRISLQCIAGRSMIWQCDLSDVTDDLESLYLQAQKAVFRFSLDVPGKGQVEGVLYYFPFQNEQETLPVEDFNLVHNPITNYNMTQQQQAGNGPTQPLNTQGLNPRQTQAHLNEAGSGGEDAELPLWQRSKAPLFEAFWQGRLIPGARIESLPFIEKVRTKRGAAARDVMPDESFLRLRGALFFGPSFLVTRNKLTFRDNLQELLATAVPKDRAQEKLLKEWITACHAKLDKVVRFEVPGGPELQAEAKKQLKGEASAFERTADGVRTVQRGDIVRLGVRPVLVGRVAFFSVAQNVQEEGVYANGCVTVQPLPEEVYGSSARKTHPLRRIEAVLGEAEAEAHVDRELSKVPTTLVLDADQLPAELQAGDDIPETSVSIYNGAKQRVVKGNLGGEKQTYAITQRLWFCPTSAVAEEDGPPPAAAPAEVPARQAKKKRKKGKQAVMAPIIDQAVGPVPHAELVLEVENAQPSEEVYQFASNSCSLERAGSYVLQYVMSPCRPNSDALTTSASLEVVPGPAVELIVQGEGRAAMATADLMLGEWLPDINLLFKDEFGNMTMRGIQPEDRPSIQVMRQAGNEEQCSKVADLEVFSNQALAEDGNSIVLRSMQVFGPNNFLPGSGPLSIFAEKRPVTPEEGNAQGPEVTEEVALREVNICFWWPSLPAQLVPLRLLPGLPRMLCLMPGHPFTSEPEDADQVMTQLPAARSGLRAVLASGSALPDFQVQAKDQWENPTAPCPEMPFDLVVSSEALDPSKSSFRFDPLASILGLTAVSTGSNVCGGAVVPLVCRLVFPGATEEAAREVLGGGDLPRLDLGIALQPSTAPADLRLLLDGTEVPIQVGEDGQNRVAVIEGAKAGSLLQKLAFQCLDEAGRLAEAGTAGKFQVSWSRGSKRVRLQEEPLPLPDIQVQEQVKPAPASLWMRFSAAGGVTLELAIKVIAIAAEPHSWSAAALDGESEASQGIDANGNIQCGQFFRVEVSVLDAFNNRCTGALSLSVPTPTITPEAANPADELAYNQEEWEQGWVEKESGNDAYLVKMRVGGNPGPFHLHVCDSAADGGESILQTDCLNVTLEPGPPSCLMFDAPTTLSCGTRSTLGELRVKATDDYGNVAAGNSFEVALLPNAVSTDGTGQAASVTAAGGNKARVKNGTGIFKDVRLSAEQSGSYILRAKPSSRQVSGEASLTVQMVPVNAVTAISVTPPVDLPAIGLPAGSSSSVVVSLETEDGNPIPQEAAAEGLTVRMVLPRGGRQSMQILEPADVQGLNVPAGCFAYSTGLLTMAGEHTISAEFLEARPELAPPKKARQTAVQSIAVALPVAPGPACRLALESHAQPERLTVTNASPQQERLLLQSAALQLQDEFGNAVSQEGVVVQISLGWPEAGGTKEGELPELELTEESIQETDQQGRAFFGNVLIAEGTGRASLDESAGASDSTMELEVLISADDPLGKPIGVWRCVVLFSDDALKFSTLKRLNEQQQGLAARKHEILEGLASVREAASSAAGAHKHACRTVEARQREVGGPCLEDAAAVKAALAVAQQRQQQSADACTSYEARFGAQDLSMTKAITKLLQSGEEGIVGVFAQLGTVDHVSLAQVLSANYRSMLVVLIVQDADCRKRLEALVAQHRMIMPDVLCLTHVLKFDKSTRGEVPGWRGAGELARRLQDAACGCTDLPLPIPLPHTRAINAAKKEIQRMTLGPNEWPDGCLGYTCNLVRPVVQGHRASLLYPLLGSSVVFETLQHAQAYREYCTQVLRTPVADLITLDQKRISGKGIISGSSFKVQALADAAVRFGSTPSEQAPEATQARHQETALEQLLEALQCRDEAALQLEQAKQEEETMERQWQDKLSDLEAQIRALNVQLGSQAQGGQSSGKKRLRQKVSAATRRNASEDNQENDGPAQEKIADTWVATKKPRPKRQRLTRMNGN